MHDSFVSVVVPTYKRPDLLERCLRAILAQDYPRSAYEIIVVDDAADAETRKLVEAISSKNEAYIIWPVEVSASVPQKHSKSARDHALVESMPGELVRLNPGPSLRYIAIHGEHGPAVARNAGWQAAQGQIIAFTDDDTVPSPGWLTAGVGAFDENTAGVSGKIVMPIPILPTDYEKDAAGLERSEFVTANCFYRRAALEAAGGFDPRFKVAWREDTDLFFKMLEKGFSLKHASEAIVVHPIRQAKWGISLKQQKKSMYNALLYKKHPMLYRERVQPKPPYFYYACVATFSIAAVALGLGLVNFGAVALSVWAGLTLSFVTLRLRGTVRNRSHVLEMVVTSALIPFLSVFWRLYGALIYRVWFL